MEPRLRHAVQIITPCHEHPNGRSRVLIQENWQCVAGGIWWATIIPQHWQRGTTVHKHHAGSFIKHVVTPPRSRTLLSGNICFPWGSILHKQHLHAQTKPVYSPVGRSLFPHCVAQHERSGSTLNKLFRRASCHLQTACSKQHEIIHSFNV